MLKKVKNLQDINFWKETVFEDDRGFFQEVYNKKTLKKKFKESINVYQQNISFSKKGVARGLHYQFGQYAQTKLVSVINGSILDIVVDLRKNSKTYGCFNIFEMNSINGHRILIPKGFAHGFLSLEKNTVVSYLVDKPYNLKSEGSINFSLLKDKFPINFDKIIQSEKDKSATVNLPLL